MLPARYYTTGVGADLHINQLNKLPCFEGIEDVYAIVDIPDVLVAYFEIPSFYGSEDIYSKRAVNHEQFHKDFVLVHPFESFNLGCSKLMNI